MVVPSGAAVFKPGDPGSRVECGGSDAVSGAVAWVVFGIRREAPVHRQSER
ncbi:hypothetical protein [Halosimplex pelagicum]|uniref:Uncharacterized protein n=1 Tax=Halosimplex pelagicum TaxID=869886 RepID=A0A7D5T4E3_9EURY|nr:hypothetical protein [Halosimplex pelagicum]QLH81408.1 hypothetical protein HZS54_07100 [Halosimplex pelagicum]